MRARSTWVALAAALIAFDAGAATVLVTNLTDGASTCPSAGACTLRGAIAFAIADDSIEFAPALVFPATVQLAGTELTINKNLTLIGPGSEQLAVRAASARRVLAVTVGNVTIEKIALIDGMNVGLGGVSAAPGSGGFGQSAADGEGGCIRTSAGTSLVLRQVALRSCEAAGGNGGAGGSGINAAPPGPGGSGGSGGSARGGAIASLGQLTLIESSVQSSTARGGAGGMGGAGGNSTFLTTGGDGAAGGTSGSVRGGAIHVAPGGALLIRNSTLAGNTATTSVGGFGGNGGQGSGFPDGRGGNGGAGGSAAGGQVFLAGSLSLADVEFSTLGPAAVVIGPGGIPGSGSQSGAAGVTGVRGGEVLSTTTTQPRVLKSAFVGNNIAVDCEGTVNANGVNLDSDNSCTGFTLQGTSAATFRNPTFEVQRGRAVLVPLGSSPLIDSAASCNSLSGSVVAIDQSGQARPVDGNSDGTAVCDVGAIEYDPRLFGNGFE